MFAAERYAKIRQVLLEYGRIDTVTICSLLSVSETTARRDLEKLENKGFLVRTHGGAIIDRKDSLNSNIDIINDLNTQKYDEIALLGSQFVQSGDVIFIDSGDIAPYFPKHLKEKTAVTIVTNSVNCAMACSEFLQIKLLSTGGQLEVSGDRVYFSGEIVRKGLENMFFSKAFVMADGIDIQFGYTVQDMQQAELVSYIKGISEEIFLLADHSKFGERSFARIGDIHTFSKVLTNMQLDTSYKQFFFDNNIQIFTALDHIK